MVLEDWSRKAKAGPFSCAVFSGCHWCAMKGYLTCSIEETKESASSGLRVVPMSRNWLESSGLLR